jgi:TPR repeat protein
MMMLKRWIIASGLAFSLLAQAAAAGPMEDAEAAYNRGDYETALQILKPLAALGNASAQQSLGAMYAKGQGVSQNYAEALKWFRKAADQGLATAQSNIGNVYAAGLGVPQDYAEARKWFYKSAGQGEPFAQTSIGSLYDNGFGVAQSFAEAVNWYRLAAEQGYPKAQGSLGVKYEFGQGVSRDFVTAYMWYDLAITGLPTSETKFRNYFLSRREQVSKHLTAHELTEAQRLAKEWTAGHSKK